MDKNIDFSGFSPYDNLGDLGNSDMYKDPMFNPMLQYEQAYMYYRYLTMQMEYKIKCKEYERMTSKDRQKNRIIKNSLENKQVLLGTQSRFFMMCTIVH